MAQQQAPTIGLPGATIAEAITAQEKNSTLLQIGLGDAFQRCITHFDEDSIPHHPGEKTCMDRAMTKLGFALHMSKDAKKAFDERCRDFDNPAAVPKWIAVLDEEHAKHMRKA